MICDLRILVMGLEDWAYSGKWLFMRGMVCRGKQQRGRHDFLISRDGAKQ